MHPGSRFGLYPASLPRAGCRCWRLRRSRAAAHTGSGACGGRGHGRQRRRRRARRRRGGWQQATRRATTAWARQRPGPKARGAGSGFARRRVCRGCTHTHTHTSTTFRRVGVYARALLAAATQGYRRRRSPELTTSSTSWEAERGGSHTSRRHHIRARPRPRVLSRHPLQRRPIRLVHVRLRRPLGRGRGRRSRAGLREAATRRVTAAALCRRRTALPGP